MRKLSGLAGASMLVAGCYTMEPVQGAVPAAGTEIAFDISDVGRVALGGTIGPEISQVQGRLLDKTPDFLVAVSAVEFLRGGEQTWQGQQVHIKPEYVTAVYERRFSRSKSLMLAGLGVAAGVAIATRGILGSGTGGTAVSIPDTARQVLRPARP